MNTGESQLERSATPNKALNTHCMHAHTCTYPALLLTAVKPFTPVFNKLLIRFSGIPQSPKPVNKEKMEEIWKLFLYFTYMIGLLFKTKILREY